MFFLDEIFNDFPLLFEHSEYFLNFTNAQISINCRNAIQRLQKSARKFDLAALKSETLI